MARRLLYVTLHHLHVSRVFLECVFIPAAFCHIRPHLMCGHGAGFLIQLVSEAVLAEHPVNEAVLDGDLP